MFPLQSMESRERESAPPLRGEVNCARCKVFCITLTSPFLPTPLFPPPFLMFSTSNPAVKRITTYSWSCFFWDKALMETKEHKEDREVCVCMCRAVWEEGLVLELTLVSFPPCSARRIREKRRFTRSASKLSSTLRSRSSSMMQTKTQSCTRLAVLPSGL